jgi:hypothetical protein
MIEHEIARIKIAVEKYSGQKCIGISVICRFSIQVKQILTRKSSEGHQAKRRKEEKPKPEEQEGMPQRQHCPTAKRRGDRNPEYHEEQQKDVA